MKRAVKALANGFALLLALLPAACSGFGRILPIFTFFGQLASLFPGIPGNYLRIAYYHLTLPHCPLSSRVSFGSYVGKNTSTIGESVYIGSWCVLGNCRIGDRTQIADHVQIPSGRRQHARTESGNIGSSENFGIVEIGPDCWIGTSAVVMDCVGPRSTVGAASVVTRPVPPDTVVAGNPARDIGAA